MNTADFAAPIDHRWLEDYVPGTVVAYGSIQVEAADIIAFAQRFDPQEFHLDAQRAAEGPFGGLIASGWHTCSIAMRLLVDGLLANSSSLGSPGVEQIRWVRPVRPGDTLHAVVTVLEFRPSQSKPDRGTVKIRTEMTNQHGEQVMWMESFGMFARRG